MNYFSAVRKNTNLNVQCDINNNWYFWKKHLTTWYLFHDYFLHIYVANYDFFKFDINAYVTSTTNIFRVFMCAIVCRNVYSYPVLTASKQ